MCLLALRITTAYFEYPLTSKEHDDNGEDLLRVRVGRHVTEAHAGEAAERVVERRDVHAVVTRSRIRAVSHGCP